MVTNQDLIGYHNPSYFEDVGDWQGYRRTTRIGAGGRRPGGVLLRAMPATTRSAEDLVEPERASVVHIGVDHKFCGSTEPVAPARREPAAGRAPRRSCASAPTSGTRTGCSRCGCSSSCSAGTAGRAVCCSSGPRVSQGSSTPDEAQVLALAPGLANAALDFAAVSEAEKAWLYRRARLVLYPTVYEGFGLVPFEAPTTACRACGPRARR